MLPSNESTVRAPLRSGTIEQMDTREQAFREKFAGAANHLGCAPEQLISLKFRGGVNSYQEYKELLHALEHEAGVRHTPLQGNFQGNGYLVEKSRTKVIIVEHETGLEILYIAGSIASLLSLIPVILGIWNLMRNGRNRHHLPPEFHDIETRRIDGNGNLVEDHNPHMDIPWAGSFGGANTVLLSAVEEIEGELHTLKASVGDLSTRLGTVERALATKSRASQQKAKSAKVKKKKPKGH
jgi:hypothetical protein